MQEVNWDDVNLLELGVLLDMAKDGYFFQIADGRWTHQVHCSKAHILNSKEGLCTIRMILT